jgi:hypothetical protein
MNGSGGNTRAGKPDLFIGTLWLRARIVIPAHRHIK